MSRATLLVAIVFATVLCGNAATVARTAGSQRDNRGRDDVLSGAVRMITITTRKGNFKV